MRAAVHCSVPVALNPNRNCAASASDYIMNSRFRRKAPEPPAREQRLRQIRAGAQTLRSTCPGARLVTVQLDFLTDAAQTPAAAAQSFVLYPGARAVFCYPCPYGDCDGIYDLSSEADKTLNRQAPRATGISHCCGTRSQIALPKRCCGLRVRYTIVAKHERPARLSDGAQVNT